MIVSENPYFLEINIPKVGFTAPALQSSALCHHILQDAGGGSMEECVSAYQIEAVYVGEIPSPPVITESDILYLAESLFHFQPCLNTQNQTFIFLTL